MSKAEVTEYLKAFAPEQRKSLQQVREDLHALLPSGVDTIAWSMPGIRIDGELILNYAGFKNHNSIFPGAGSPFEGYGPEIEKYRTSKGALQFGREERFPKALLKKIVGFRINEINESFPKKSGVFKEFYTSGQLKVSGTVKSGERHGTWNWYKIDGTVKRTAQFKNGVAVKN